MSTLHSSLSGTNIHVPYAWSYADSATREAASGFVAGDVGKLALQEDDNSLWLLSATTPTWVAVGAAGGDTTAIHDDTAGEIHAVSEKATPVDADEVLIEDSADTYSKKRVQLSNLLASATDSDAIHDNVSGEIVAVTEKASPVSADVLLIEDSEASNAKKRVQLGNLPSAAAGNISTINFVIDGGGEAITTGIKGSIVVDFACTITGVTTLADQSGDIVVDIWKDSYANFPPTDADSITSATPPTLSSADKAQDTTLSGWTTSISAGDILRFNVDSATTVTRVTVALKVSRT